MELTIVGGAKNWIKVSYNGVYDYSKVYRNAVNWFKKHGYFFHEKTHIEAVKSTGKDHIINFIGERRVDDYVKYTINVEIWTLRTVPIKGEKNLVNGEIQFRFKGAMELDYKNTFEKTFGKKLGPVFMKIYHRYFFKSRIWGKYAPGIYIETNDLIKNVKTNLGLMTSSTP